MSIESEPEHNEFVRLRLEQTSSHRGAPSPSGKAGVCKTLTPRFDSERRLQHERRRAPHLHTANVAWESSITLLWTETECASYERFGGLLTTRRQEIGGKDSRKGREERPLSRHVHESIPA